MDEQIEVWKDLPMGEYDTNRYQVSNLGRVRLTGPGEAKGFVLKTTRHPNGYLVVSIKKNQHWRTRYVHQLVLETFVGPRPEIGMRVVTRHLNSNQTDNRLTNLAWGTMSQNMIDCVRAGNHPQARKTHCLRGHEFTPANTRARSDRPGHRECLTCILDRRAARKALVAA